ncbi:MAG: hypothetical protein R2941_14635 [Desulfobacterales bacterium]
MKNVLSIIAGIFLVIYSLANFAHHSTIAKAKQLVKQHRFVLRALQMAGNMKAQLR